MKSWILCIITLLTADLCYACGPYYPGGEDVRFRLIDPLAYGLKTYRDFNYTVSLLYPQDVGDSDTLTSSEYDANVGLWAKYCRNRADSASVEEAIYTLTTAAVNDPHNNNKTFVWLYKTHDTAAIRYLQFAKQCEVLNTFFGDPWERQQSLQLPQRQAMIDSALQRAATAHGIFRYRYAFLAIRLAYYNNNPDALKNIFDKYFARHRERTILDYWSMHFRALIEKEGPLKNFYAAQAFTYAPDKQQVIYQWYTPTIPVAATLKYATTKQEQAAVWLLQGIRSEGRALDCVEHLYHCAPHSEAADFLLMRELNKLEDWICTPVYSGFDPSLRDTFIENSDKIARALSNVDRDKAYALRLLVLIDQADIEHTAHPAVWQTARAYIHCMTGHYSQSLTALKKIRANGHPAVARGAALIRGLCLTALQPSGRAVVPAYVKPLLMDTSYKNYRFIFAVARELEMRGNTTIAALLFSRLNNGSGQEDEWDDGNMWSHQVYWRTRKNHNTLYADYYDNYFFYLDAQYTPEQLVILLNAIHTHHSDNAFDRWAYNSASYDRDRLQDLLGTKYIRQNRLQEALNAFSKINDSLWASRRFHYKYLDANPFYNNLYNEHTHTAADSAHLPKQQIVRQLIALLNHAANTHNNDRDSCYFLAANCYFNMTQYGNSWMMRRYYWTNAETETKLEDDDEYFHCDLAKQYYLKAKDAARNRKFAALCLRMAGRCEKYRLYNESASSRYSMNAADSIFHANRYYTQLRRQYPDCYDDLISNCESFHNYFSAR